MENITMANKTIGYLRVSTHDQTNDLQRDALIKAGVPPQNIFEEKISGKFKERPQLAACLDALHEGDTLVVYKLDRLSRSLKHLLDIIETIQRRNIVFKSLSEEINTATPMGRCFFHITAALTQLEREVIVERTVAGLAAARARGAKLGKPPKVAYDEAKIRELLKEYTIAAVVEYTGVSTSTVSRISTRMNRQAAYLNQHVPQPQTVESFL